MIVDLLRSKPALLFCPSCDHTWLSDCDDCPHCGNLNIEMAPNLYYQYADSIAAWEVTNDEDKPWVFAYRSGEEQDLWKVESGLKGRVDAPMFELAAFPTWRGTLDADAKQRAFLKAVTHMNQKQYDIMIFLENQFSTRHGYPPNKCIIPYREWDCSLPVDDGMRTGMIVYRELGIVMLG